MLILLGDLFAAAQYIKVAEQSTLQAGLIEGFTERAIEQIRITNRWSYPPDYQWYDPWFQCAMDAD